MKKNQGFISIALTIYAMLFLTLGIGTYLNSAEYKEKENLNVGETVLSLPVRNFLALTDTPNSYSGQGSKVVSVNAGATALEFTTPGGGAPTTADYLVGTANGSLSAEIVVGTSPGGELGNTWASPTIDDGLSVDGWTITGATLTASGLITGNANLNIANGATSSGILKILEDTDDGSNYTTFQVPALSSNITYTLPSDDGDSGEFLQTNGSGVLSWVASSLNDLLDVVIDTPLVDQILKYNGTNWVNGEQTTVNAGSGVDYFFNTTDSDITGYDTLERAPQNVAEQDLTVVANNNTVAIQEYSSPSGGLGGTQIDAGVWSFDIYSYASLLTLESHIELKLYSRTTGGTETLLFTVNSGELSDALQLQEITSIQQAFVVNSTDRLIVKVSGVTSNTSNTTIHFAFGGTENYSSISTPLVVRHNDLVGLQGGTSSQYYHLTSAEYTGTGSGNFVRTTSPTITTPAIAGATMTGVLDAGGADSLEIPNGSSPTVNATGEIAVDTTSDHIEYYGSSTARIISPIRQTGFSLETPTDADDNIPFFFPREAITVTDVYCEVDGGTSIALTISDGTNALEAITCDADGAEDDGSIANGTFASNERMEFDLASTSGVNTWLYVSVTYVITAD